MIHLNFYISRSTGVVQINKLAPLKLVYQKQHNNVVGRTWEQHHASFARFVAEKTLKSIVEIGGGHGHLAKALTVENPNLKRHMADPNPTITETSQINLYRMYSDEFFKKHADLMPGSHVVHSHLIEHLYDPVTFVRTVSRSMALGQVMFFSIPDLLALMKLGSPSMHVEHTVLLREEHLAWILESRPPALHWRKFKSSALVINPIPFSIASAKAQSVSTPRSYATGRRRTHTWRPKLL